MYCKHCQRELPDDYTFCPHCGQTITDPKEPKQASSKPEAPKKKKKHPVRAFLILFAAAALLWCNFRHPKACPEPAEAVQTLSTETAATGASMPLDEYFLSFRDKGACGKLTGTVGVYFIFVDDDESSWTQDQIDVFFADANTRLDALEAEASRWKASLDFSTGYCHTKVTGIIDSQNKFDFRDTILESSGFDPQNTHGQIIQYLHDKNHFSVQQGFPVFVVNKAGRDAANNETAFLFRDAHALLHEMSHVFGTQDYYYLDDVEDEAERLLGEGIVLGGEEETIMDPLSAYQVGWTDTLSPKAEEFLWYLSKYTREDWTKAHEADTFTGYGTKVTDEYTYEGDLLYGCFHGQGTIRWTNGNSYTGDFDNNLQHGYGIFAYADGGWYEGEFHEGQFHGQGVHHSADGSWYEGEFRNGWYHGVGTHYRADGGRYEGEFCEGLYQGKGIHYRADGDRYEGEFYGGWYHGRGVFTHADGSVGTGRWEMGTYIGK